MTQKIIEALTHLSPGVAYAVAGIKRKELLGIVGQVQRNDVRFNVVNCVVQTSGEPAQGVCVMVENISNSAQRRNEVIDELQPGMSATFTAASDAEYNSIKNALKYRRRANPNVAFTAKKKGDKVTVTRNA